MTDEHDVKSGSDFPMRHIVVVHENIWDGIQEYLHSRGLTLFQLPADCDADGTPVWSVGVGDELWKLIGGDTREP